MGRVRVWRSTKISCIIFFFHNANTVNTRNFAGWGDYVSNLLFAVFSSSNIISLWGGGSVLCPFDSKGFKLHWEVAWNNITYVICIPQHLCGTNLNIYIYLCSIFKEHNFKNQNVNSVHAFLCDHSKVTSWNMWNRFCFRYFSQNLTDEWSEIGQKASFVKLKKNTIGAFALRKQKEWTGLVVGLQCVTWKGLVVGLQFVTWKGPVVGLQCVTWTGLVVWLQCVTWTSLVVGLQCVTWTGLVVGLQCVTWTGLVVRLQCVAWAGLVCWITVRYMNRSICWITVRYMKRSSCWITVRYMNRSSCWIQYVTTFCGTFKILSHHFIIYSHNTMTYTTLHKM